MRISAFTVCVFDASASVGELHLGAPLSAAASVLLEPDPRACESAG
jgi:hypothetical protein